MARSLALEEWPKGSGTNIAFRSPSDDMCVHSAPMLVMTDLLIVFTHSWLPNRLSSIAVVALLMFWDVCASLQRASRERNGAIRSKKSINSMSWLDFVRFLFSGFIGLSLGILKTIFYFLC